MAAKGSVLIDRRDPRVGGDYVVRHRTRDGAWHHTDRWTHYSVIGGRMRQSHDEAGRLAWLQGLMDSGLIGSMPYEVLEDKIEILNRRIREYSTMAGPRAEQRIAEAEAQIAAMEAAWARQFDGAEVPHIVAPAAPAPEAKDRATVTRKPRRKADADV
jgi:hypothetical protein